MTEHKFNELPQTYEQYIIPTVEEIRDKKVQLSTDYVNKLLDPNARFNGNCEVRCSYWDCPWPSSVKFEIEIYIDGWSRKWACRPNYGTFLTGDWEWSPTNSYLYRKDLWLTHLGHAEDVIPLILSDDVWTTNLWGRHCMEDGDLCNATLKIIRECIKHHKNGYEIKVRETINSEISRWSNFGLKIVGSTAATAVLGPVALPIGVATWGVGKIGEELCDDEQGRVFFRTVGGIGGDVAMGEIVGGLVSGATQTIGHEAAYQIASHGRQMTNGAKVLINGGRAIKRGKGAWDFYQEIGKPTWQIAKHVSHLDRGTDYDSNCEICEN